MKINNTALIRHNCIKISDNLTIHIPTLEEIDDFGEEEYYGSVSLLCSTPSDYKVFLWDKLNVDWVDLDDYQWFQAFYKSFSDDFSRLILKDVLFSDLEIAVENETQRICLINKEENIIFTEQSYNDLADLFRKIHGFSKNVDKPANQTTHDYLLKRERKKAKRIKQEEFSSVVFPIICSLVNSSNFKYNYETVWKINIFELMESLKRIQKIYNFNQYMTGVYSGMVDTSKIDTKVKNEIMDWFGATE